MSEFPGTFEELARFRQGMYRIFSAAFLAPQPERLLDLMAGADMLEGMGMPYLAFYREWVPWGEALRDIDDVTLSMFACSQQVLPARSAHPLNPSTQRTHPG